MNLQLSSELYETGTIHLPKCHWLMAALSGMNKYIQNTCLQAGNTEGTVQTEMLFWLTICCKQHLLFWLCAIKSVSTIINDIDFLLNSLSLTRTFTSSNMSGPQVYGCKRLERQGKRLGRPDDKMFCVVDKSGSPTDRNVLHILPWWYLFSARVGLFFFCSSFSLYNDFPFLSTENKLGYFKDICNYLLFLLVNWISSQSKFSLQHSVYLFPFYIFVPF